jgi:hypothetical protein
MNTSFYTEEQMIQEVGQAQAKKDELVMDASKIGDLSGMMVTINEMVKIMSRPEYVSMKQNNDKMYKQVYNEFIESPAYVAEQEKYDNAILSEVELAIDVTTATNEELDEVINKITATPKMKKKFELMQKKQNDLIYDFNSRPKIYKLLREYENIFHEKYKNRLPIKIINLLVDDVNNIEGLKTLFETLSTVKNGQSDIYEEHDKFAEKLNEKYLYPKFGGKEKLQEIVNNNKSG